MPQITKCQKTDPSQIFPLIPKQLSEFSKLKNQPKKWPLQIQKPKISFESQNVRKQTLPKYAHWFQNRTNNQLWFQNNFQNFQNSKIKLKNYPLKSKTPKISLKSQNFRKPTPPKYAHRFQNNLPNFQNSKIKLKNYSLKSKT